MYDTYETSYYGIFYFAQRSHAHIDTRRREPWLYSAEEMSRIRDAVRLRYAHLPLIYTLFYEGEVDGAPVMRPVWYEFPGEEEGFSVEDEYLLGDSLLVRPVTKQGATSVPVYFPGGEKQYWLVLSFICVLLHKSRPIS